MTMDENVAKAMDRVQIIADTESEWADIDIADWQTIRARLVELEAENERLRDWMEPKVRELHYDANGLRSMLEGGACKALAESFAEQFTASGAVNYLDVTFMAKDGTSFVVTVQKRLNPTAHELRQKAEARAEKAEALLRDVLDGYYTPPRLADRITAHLSENGHEHS